MTLNVTLEQCGAGWKVLAEIHDVVDEEGLTAAQKLVERAAEFSMALPGWNPGKQEREEPEGNKWRKAYFARRNWARGGAK